MTRKQNGSTEDGRTLKAHAADGNHTVDDLNPAPQGP